MVAAFAAAALANDGHQRATSSNWLLLVTTDSADPLREAEFNAWYDKIDIPDVLGLHGYSRARRGDRQIERGLEKAKPPGHEGRYVALYDLETDDLDKSVAEMRELSRRMKETGRSTDLLQVVEGVYYRQLEHTYDARRRALARQGEYLYLVRFDCCEDDRSEGECDSWYRRVYIPTVMNIPELIDATRYERILVRRASQEGIPRYLTVFHLESGTPRRAMELVAKISREMRNAAGVKSACVERSSAIYREIADVRSQGR